MEVQIWMSIYQSIADPKIPRWKWHFERNWTTQTTCVVKRACIFYCEPQKSDFDVGLLGLSFCWRNKNCPSWTKSSATSSSSFFFWVTTKTLLGENISVRSTITFCDKIVAIAEKRQFASWNGSSQAWTQWETFEKKKGLPFDTDIQPSCDKLVKFTLSLCDENRCVIFWWTFWTKNSFHRRHYVDFFCMFIEVDLCSTFTQDKK